MDFPDKDAMPWTEASGRQSLFDYPLFMPEFPFPGLPDPQQFFFLPEQDFQLFQAKREEETDPNPLLFYQPELLYGLQEGMTAPSEWQEPVERPRPHPPRILPLAVPYQHTKQVGTISVEERRAKIEKYLQKRSRRTYGKKVFYACRKRVADTRVRVKGRFVTKKMAESLRTQEAPNSSE
jgi:hypothetical protein